MKGKGAGGFRTGIDIGSEFVKVAVSRGKTVVAAAAAVIHRDLRESIQRALSTALADAGFLNRVPSADLFRVSAASLLLRKRIAVTGDAHHLRFPYEKRTSGFCLRKLIGEDFHDGEVLVLNAGNITMEAYVLSRRNKILDVYRGDNCTAGCGRFIENACRLLSIDISRGVDPIEAALRRSSAPVSFSPGCSIFSESEIISMVNSGFRREDILNGALHSAAEKIATLYDAKEHSFAGKVYLIGGPARIPSLVGLVEELIKHRIDRPPIDPWYALAAGASLP